MSNFSTWLHAVQGLLVSQELLQEIRQRLLEKNIVYKRDIHEFIKANYGAMDVNYIYQNITGLHIRILTEEETAQVLEEYASLLVKPDIQKVHNMYILTYICKKRNIDVNIYATYPAEKMAIYDAILSG